ncbi:MAG: hypothetical protein QXE79_07220 [Candidatus Bathyarchaeia archaeon]
MIIKLISALRREMIGEEDPAVLMAFSCADPLNFVFSNEVEENCYAKDMIVETLYEIFFKVVLNDRTAVLFL